MKHCMWLIVIIWSCSCSMVVMGAASAELEEVNAAAVSYWETRLPTGAGMPPSLRAMVSPLSSHEASQLFISIQQLGSHYLPTHAESFCAAAHIRCPHQRRSAAHSETLKKEPKLDSHSPRIPTKPAELPSDVQNRLVFYYAHEKKGSGDQTQEVSPVKEPTSDPAKLKQDGPRREISHMFFREQQILVRGVDIHVNFAYGVDETAEERAFLPRTLAKLFPLAADGGAEIASKLGLLKEDVQSTIQSCFVGANMHTDVDLRRCFSSIEDVADFVWSVMGESIINIYDAITNASTVELMKAGKTFHVEDVKTLKADRDEPAVVCHDMVFPFRVFYCHYVKQTMLFQVTLRSVEDGSVHQRIAMCHYDTSYWSPMHMSFAYLNAKPGEGEACHWLGAGWLQRRGWAFVRGAASATT